MSKKIIMTVLGAEAVGKTTLLASMYSHLARRGNALAGFSMEAVGDTGVELQKARDKLARVLEEPNFTDISRLLPGSQGIHEYKFKICFHNSEILDLSCHDHAGGILLESGENTDYQEFENVLSNADIVINVVDGAALMEGSEPYSIKINKPTRTMELLNLAARNNKPNLILFVVTKCESWLKDEKSTQKLREAFEIRHKEVLEKVRGRQDIVGIFIPVKTLNCVEFSLVENKGKAEEKILFSKNPLLDFEQLQVEQPLIYALIFILSPIINKNIRNISWWQKLFGGGEEHVEMKKALLRLQEEELNNKLRVYGDFSLLEI